MQCYAKHTLGSVVFFWSLPRSGKKFRLFLELILEFFGAKRQFFLEVIFGVFESLDLWSSNILSSETHKIEREIASETLYMDFFRRCAALLSQKVITNWCFPLIFSQLYCKLGRFFLEFFLEFFAAKRRYFLELFLEFFRREAAKIWRFFLEVS